MKRDLFIEQNEQYIYFSFSRNPYDRIISAFFYLNPNTSKDKFKYFIKNKLPTLDFNLSFDCSIIHYYPQYLFLCDETLTLSSDINIKKIKDCESPKKYNLSEYFDNECIDIVGRIYEKDLLLNYSKT